MSEQKRILYVEDNIDTAEAVQIILRKAGFEIEIVHCGNDCLRLVETKEFDMYLLDVMLPDMSGWDIFEKVKLKSNGAKFAFLSAIPVSTERVSELKKAGVSDYIMKPFHKEDLIIRIKKVLEIQE